MLFCGFGCIVAIKPGCVAPFYACPAALRRKYGAGFCSVLDKASEEEVSAILIAPVTFFILMRPEMNKGF